MTAAESRPQRIALFLPSLNGGGAQRVMVNIANGMARSGRAVDLVLASATGAYLDQVDQQVRIVDLQAGRVGKSLLRLAAYLRRERPAALFAAIEHANLGAVLANLLAGRCTRVVVCVHSSYSRLTAATTLTDRYGYPLLTNLLYRFADAVVAVSQGAAQDLVDICGIPRHRITVIPNPVIGADLPARGAAPPPHPWFAPGEPPVVLSVGRLEAPKDFATLIAAFAALRRELPARLLILGEGKERGELEAQVRELGLGAEVQLPGFVDNPYSYMKHAAVFVLSSRSEALPTVLIEALALGCPVVATDCPNGPREILALARVGTLVPVGEPQALTAALAATLAAAPHPPESAVTERLHCFRQEAALQRYLDLIALPR